MLGVDGGGSKTVCWLAGMDAGSRPMAIGRGTSGAANPQSVGWEAAVRELNRAIDAAFADAGLGCVPVAAACVALAGGDRDTVRQPLERWAAERQLAARFAATHDGLPILAAGTADGHGIALISGTGSFAFGRTAAGATARAGGWGYLFGDEGSGYAIALAGLRAAAQAADGRGPETLLTAQLLAATGASEAAGLIEAVYPRAAERRWLARLARPVLETAAGGDAVARGILTAAAGELAEMVVAVAASLGLERDSYPLALGGGVLIHCDAIRIAVQQTLTDRRLAPGTLQVVPEPVSGAVRLAGELLDAATRRPS